MAEIPPEVRQQINAADPQEREEAAEALGRQPGAESLRLLKGLLADERSAVARAAVRSLAARGSREAAAEIIPLLRSEEARLRSLAVEILVKMGPAALPPIIALLDDLDQDLRKFGVDILGMMRAPEGEDPLIRALFDGDINVATAAAEALEAVGTQRAVPHLVECLGGEPWLKYAALKSLGAIGGEAALEAILAIDPEEESMFLFQALNALGNIGDGRGLGFIHRLLEGPDPALLPTLVQAAERLLRKADEETIQATRAQMPVEDIVGLLHHDRTEVARCAIGLLGLFREGSAVGELARLYTEANQHLFEALEEAFLRIDPDQVEPFIEIIQSPMESASVKIAAVRLLGRLDRKVVFEPLVRCLEGGRGDLRKEIVRALAALADRRALPILHGLLEEAETGLGEAAVEALETFRDTSSVPLLMKLAGAASEPLRAQAAQSLTTYELEDYREDLAALLSAARPEVVAFGLEAIPAALLPAFEEAIVDLCHHADGGVRQRAVAQCGVLANDAGFERVAAALRDEMPRVRLAGLRALEHFPGRDAAPLLLHAVATDPEEWNRYEAARLIGQLGRAEAVSELVAGLDPAPDLVKAGILDALGDLGAAEHAALIRDWAGSEDELVREAALEALDKIAGRGPSRRPSTRDRDHP